MLMAALEFMYKGKCEVSEQLINEFLTLGNELQIEGLADDGVHETTNDQKLKIEYNRDIEKDIEANSDDELDLVSENNHNGFSDEIVSTMKVYSEQDC